MRPYCGRMATTVTVTRERVIAGVALIGIGVLSFAGNALQTANLGLLFPAALGLIFLAWGLTVRNAGLLIPGGILFGIGSGIVLMQLPNLHALPDGTNGGVFLLAFAGGWGLIAVLSALFTSDRLWWALIPGAILACVGIALLSGGIALQALTLVSFVWPLALVGFGALLIARRSVSASSGRNA
jgi:hypothetical protein